MPKNIEIKAKIGKNKSENLHQLLTELCGKPRELMRQEDTFFNVKNGRLKLRDFPGHPNGKCSELIHYERSDENGPKLSEYVKANISIEESGNLKKVLTRANGTKGPTLRKQRILYIYKGQTRIHMDEVENLGNFIEFEVCLRDDQNEELGKQIADELMTKLGIDEANLLKGAYLDMLIGQ